MKQRRPLDSTRATVRAGRRSVDQDDCITTVLAATLVFLLCAQGFGALIVIGEMLVMAALALRSWPRLTAHKASSALFLALPLFAVLSFLWSVVPPQTLRYAVQLLLTIIIALVLARSVPHSRFALVIFIGTAVASLVGIATGRMGMSATGPVLIGLAGSKNQMGYITLAWLLASLAVLTDSQRSLLTRLFAFACLPVALFMLAQGQVATAAVSAAVGSLLFAMLMTARWLGRTKRIVLLGFAVLVGLSLTTASPQIVAWSERVATDVFKKDMTLTGRTLLWESADKLIAERPVAGHGYRGIWMGPEGANLLARNGQRDGRAFNFHDTVREIMADLGWTGLLLLLLPLLYGLTKLVLGLVDRPSVARAFTLTLFLVIMLRMRTEVLIGPFVFDTVMLYAVLAYASAIALGPNPVQRRRRRGAKAISMRSGDFLSPVQRPVRQHFYPRP